jgi:predicted RNA-binding Zn-ribbon protein involved in translation (DUF1610 family)
VGSGRKKAAPREDAFHVPKDEEVAVAVLRAIQERGPFRSQKAFRAAVVEALRATDPKATVGEERLRHIALRSKMIHLEMDYKDGSGLVKEACPVCGAPLRRVKNRTLNRKTVVVGYECGKCVYRSPAERMRPARYQFSARRL